MGVVKSIDSRVRLLLDLNLVLVTDLQLVTKPLLTLVDLRGIKGTMQVSLRTVIVSCMLVFLLHFPSKIPVSGWNFMKMWDFNFFS